MGSTKRERQRQNREQKLAELRKQQRRALFRKRLTRSVWIGAIVAIGVFAYTSASGNPSTTTTEPDQTSTTSTTATGISTTAAPSALGASYDAFRAKPTACGADAPPPAKDLQFTEPEDLQIDPTADITATISTSCGDIVIRLDPAAAPQTVNSFVFLAERGYFDGTVFHRIVPGFVVQGGDPNASGLGGPGYTLPDEFPPDGFTYDRGVVAMANAGPGTTGSQFFVVLDTTNLPPTFSPLGQVVDGFDTLDAIAAVPVGPAPSGETSLPLETVYIDSVTIDR